MEVRTTYSIYITLFPATFPPKNFLRIFPLPPNPTFTPPLARATPFQPLHQSQTDSPLPRTPPHLICIFQSPTYLQILNSLSYFPCQEISLFCMMIYSHIVGIFIPRESGPLAPAEYWYSYYNTSFVQNREGAKKVALCHVNYVTPRIQTGNLISPNPSGEVK